MSASGTDVFARLAAEGSDALHRGDDRAAAERLAAALRACAGEDDVDVRADLLEARLRLGGHRHVVPELQRLVALHPGRERLRRQLAVALARSGRRGEALAVCTAVAGGPLLTRLQRTIERGEPLPGARSRARRLSARTLGVAVAAAVAVGAGAAIASVLARDGSPGDAASPAATVGPGATTGPARALPVARAAETLPYATDGRALWSSRRDGGAVVLVGADARARRTVAVAGHVDALAAGRGSLWIADSDAERLLRLSQRTGRETGRVRLPRGALGRGGAAAVGMADGTVWATNGGALVRVDAMSGRVEARIELDGPTALAADSGGAWVGTRTGELVRVSLRGSQTAVSRFPGVPGRVVRILRAHGSLWVARGEPADADLWRYETTRAAIFGTPLPGRFTADLVARRGAMWVRLPSSAYARIDAATSEIELVERESPSAVSPP